MYSHITLCPIPQNGEVLGKGQFRFRCHITQALNVKQGQPVRVERVDNARDFTIRLKLQRSLLCRDLGRS